MKEKSWKRALALALIASLFVGQITVNDTARAETTPGTTSSRVLTRSTSFTNDYITIDGGNLVITNTSKDYTTVCAEDFLPKAWRSSVTSIDFNGVAVLMENAFKDCVNLESVALPNGAKLSEGEFEGCSHLKEITGQALNGAFPDRVLKNTPNLRYIESDIVTIGDEALYNTFNEFDLSADTTDLLRDGSGIDLSDVTSVGDRGLSHSFNGVYRASSTSLGSTEGTNDFLANQMFDFTQCTSMGEKAFEESFQNFGAKLNLTFGVSEIKEKTFRYAFCGSDVKISFPNATKVASYAFDGFATGLCLTNITGPSGAAIDECNYSAKHPGETEIVFFKNTTSGTHTYDDSSYYNVGTELNFPVLQNGTANAFSGVFGDINNNSVIKLPALTNETDKMFEDSFHGNKDISIYLDSLGTIGERMFAESFIEKTENKKEWTHSCNVFAPNATIIGKEGFCNKSTKESSLSLKEIGKIAEVEESGLWGRNIGNFDVSLITSIGKCGFAYTTSWEKATKNLTSIATLGDNAFEGSDITNEYADTIIPLTTSLGAYVFKDCKSIRGKVDVCANDDFVINDGTFMGTMISGISYNKDIVGSIGAKTFANCAELTTFDFPTTESVTIGANAFDGAGLTSVDLSAPKKSLEIREYAFYSCQIADADLNFGNTGCTSLKIGEGAFVDNPLTDLDFNIGVGAENYPTITIGKNAFNGTPITGTITSAIHGSITIEDGAFANCPNLTTFDVSGQSNGTVMLSNDVFSNSGLVSFIGPDTNHGTFVIGTTFRNCPELKTVKAYQINALTGAMNPTKDNPFPVFENDKKLETIDITTGWTFAWIPPHCFKNCYSLSSLSLSSGVNYIGEEAFYNCRSLGEANLDLRNVKNIWSKAFYNCNLGKSVDISGATMIYDDSFDDTMDKDGCIIASPTVSIQESGSSSCETLRRRYALVMDATSATMESNYSSIISRYNNWGYVFTKDEMSQDIKATVKASNAPITDADSLKSHLTVTKHNLDGSDTILNNYDIVDVRYDGVTKNLTFKVKAYITGDTFINTKNTRRYGPGVFKYYQVPVNMKVKQILSEVTEITLNETSVQLEKGELLNLTKTTSPESPFEDTVWWASSDSGVASVKQDGTVIANHNGHATITCYYRRNMEVKAACQVVVGDGVKDTETGTISDKNIGTTPAPTVAPTPTPTAVPTATPTSTPTAAPKSTPASPYTDYEDMHFMNNTVRNPYTIRDKRVYDTFSLLYQTTEMNGEDYVYAKTGNDVNITSLRLEACDGKVVPYKSLSMKYRSGESVLQMERDYSVLEEKEWSQHMKLKYEANGQEKEEDFYLSTSHCSVATDIRVHEYFKTLLKKNQITAFDYTRKYNEETGKWFLEYFLYMDEDTEVDLNKDNAYCKALSYYPEYEPNDPQALPISIAEEDEALQYGAFPGSEVNGNTFVLSSGGAGAPIGQGGCQLNIGFGSAVISVSALSSDYIPEETWSKENRNNKYDCEIFAIKDHVITFKKALCSAGTGTEKDLAYAKAFLPVDVHTITFASDMTDIPERAHSIYSNFDSSAEYTYDIDVFDVLKGLNGSFCPAGRFKEIIVPKNIKTIPESFLYNMAIDTVTFQTDKITEIPSQAFSFAAIGNMDLSILDNKLTSIKRYAFGHMNAKIPSENQHIVLPKFGRVELMENQALEYMNLPDTDIDFSNNKYIVSIQQECFQGSIIKDLCLSNCENLNFAHLCWIDAITIDLSNCPKLTSFGDSYSNGQMGYCRADTVVLPESLTALNNYAFYNCDILHMDTSHIQILSSQPFSCLGYSNLKPNDRIMSADYDRNNSSFPEELDLSNVTHSYGSNVFRIAYHDSYAVRYPYSHTRIKFPKHLKRFDDWSHNMSLLQDLLPRDIATSAESRKTIEDFLDTVSTIIVDDDFQYGSGQTQILTQSFLDRNHIYSEEQLSDMYYDPIDIIGENAVDRFRNGSCLALTVIGEDSEGLKDFYNNTKDDSTPPLVYTKSEYISKIDVTLNDKYNLSADNNLSIEELEKLTQDNMKECLSVKATYYDGTEKILDKDDFDFSYYYDDDKAEIVFKVLVANLPVKYPFSYTKKQVLAGYALPGLYRNLVHQETVRIKGVELTDYLYAVNGLSLDKNEVSVYGATNEDNNFTLNATLSPKRVDVDKVLWSSSDENVATVDSYGNVTIHSDGVAELTAMSLDGGYCDTCSLTVQEKITNMNIGGENSIKAGGQGSYVADLTATGAIDTSVTWNISGNTSKNTKVDSNGILTVGKDEAAPAITLKAISNFDNTWSATKPIVIMQFADSITIEGPENITCGTEQTYTAKVNGSAYVSQDVTWSLTGNESPNTMVEDGRLICGTDETSDKITLKVVSAFDPDISKTKDVVVLHAAPSPAPTVEPTASPANSPTPTTEPAKEPDTPVETTGDSKVEEEEQAPAAPAATSAPSLSQFFNTDKDPDRLSRTIELSIPTIVMKKNMGVNNKFQIKLLNAKKAKIKVCSSNKKIAVINKKGVVTAKKPGKARLIINMTKGNFRMQYIVKVTVKKDVPFNYSLIKYKTKHKKVSACLYKLLRKGKSYKITLKHLGKSGKAVFKSSNPNVVSVNNKGKCISKKTGKSVITIKVRKDKRLFTYFMVIRATENGVESKTNYLKIIK